jgi:hypothetical protein
MRYSNSLTRRPKPGLWPRKSLPTSKGWLSWEEADNGQTRCPTLAGCPIPEAEFVRLRLVAAAVAEVLQPREEAPAPTPGKARGGG